jgi:YVTN family beta-propeller protein
MMFETIRQAKRSLGMSRLVTLTLLAWIGLTVSGSPVQVVQAQSDPGLLFIENGGQFEDSIRFQTYGGPATLSLTGDALWFTLVEPADPVGVAGAGDSEAPGELVAVQGRDMSQRGLNVRVSFTGANPEPRLEPFNRLDTRISYFRGADPAAWQPDVPVWGGVRYVDLYPGLDLEITAEQGRLVQRLLVRDVQAAGIGDPDQPDSSPFAEIGLQVAGAESIELADGQLRLETELGELTLPLLELDEGAAGPQMAGLEAQIEGDVIRQPFAGIGSPPAELAEIAATSDLIYSTFLGGLGDLDAGRDIDVDDSGHAYVTGQAYPGFPATPGAFDTSVDGFDSDAFVVKLNAGGSGLDFATFVGGSDFDTAWSIDVDEAGQATIAGYTLSPDFPTTPGAFESGQAGTANAFVVKVNETGTALSYAALLGGSNDDFGMAVAVDAAGSAYVTGFTPSPDFPTTPGAFDTTLAVWYDIYIAKLTPDGSDLAYSTLVGGNNAEYTFGIALDSAGSAYVTGYTHSTDFPTTPGALDTSYDEQETIVVKVSPDGSELAYSTFLGGTGTEYGSSIALDGAGSAYVTGSVRSTDFPVTAGAFDTSYNNEVNDFVGDAFVAKLNPGGSGLVYATYLGSIGDELGEGITVDEAGSAYVTGYTTSVSFPTTSDAFAPTCGNCVFPHGFVAKLNGSGTAVIYGTFLGSEDGFDRVYDVAVDSTHRVYVSGTTSSSGFPVTTGAFDISLGGFSDAFIAKLAAEGEDTEPSTIPDHNCAPTPLGTISVGNTPRGVAVDAARERVYVANFGSDSVSVIDSSTHTVIDTITGLSGATGLALDAARNLLWVTGYSSNEVTPIQIDDAATSFTPGTAIAVGQGPWGVAYDPVFDYVYVANSLGSSVSVIDVSIRAVVASITNGFNQPFHLAANPTTGKVYAANFGGHHVTVLQDNAVVGFVELYDSGQPYGIAVDEVRNQVYLATVGPARIVALGTVGGVEDKFQGWAAFYRGFGNRNRPLPLRAIAINPQVGPFGDGGHIWTTTATVDGSEQNQALFIPKGWSGYFHAPLAQNVQENPSDGVAIDRTTNRVYVTSGTNPGVVSVIGDHANVCPGAAPASVPDGTNDFDFELYNRATLTGGDVTGDGKIDLFDLTFVAARYNSSDPLADITGDGQVDISDITIVAGNYGQTVSE